MTTAIDAMRPVTGYKLVDHHQGRTVRTYEPTERGTRAARRAADRLNAEYGAHRYNAHPVFGEACNNL